MKETLQRLVKSHEKRAFEQLFSDHVDAIYRFIYWRVGDEEAAKDMTSEVFAKAWQNWATFDGAHAKAWLYTIARNLITDSYRKKSDAPLEEAEDVISPIDVVHQAEQSLTSQKLKQALEKLKPVSQQVIELRILNNFSAREVAAVMKVSEENVRQLQFRALKELRKHYEE